MSHFVFALCLYSIINLALAQEKPLIRACTEDDDSYPWLLKQREGVTVFQLRQVEKQLGVVIKLTALPWKRCISDVQQGLQDAAVKISYTPQRAQEVGVFPMQNGKLDVRKRLHTDSYSLFRLKNSNVTWDGKQLKADGAIGAQTGFSVIEQLKSLGATVDEGARKAEDHLHKLFLMRLSAVALQTQEGNNNLAKNPKFAEHIERLDPVLIEKPYFLIFSFQFNAKYPGYSQQVWDAIETVRESREFKNYFRDFK